MDLGGWGIVSVVICDAAVYIDTDLFIGFCHTAAVITAAYGYERSRFGGRACQKAIPRFMYPVLVLIASATGLAATVYTRLSDEARMVLVGVFCILGVIVTIIMLIVLVRQSNGVG